MRKRKIFKKELIEKFNIIEDEKIICNLHYSSIEDVLLYQDNGKLPFIKDEVYEAFEKILTSPGKLSNYKINMLIADKGNYSNEEIQNLLRENIAYYSVGINRKTKKLRIIVALMILVGALLLVGSYFLERTSVARIFRDIINISGTLLIWEASYKFFVERIGNNANIAKYAYLCRIIEIK